MLAELLSAAVRNQRKGLGEPVPEQNSANTAGTELEELRSALLTETPLVALCPGLGSPAQEAHGTVGEGPEETTKLLRGLENLL